MAAGLAKILLEVPFELLPLVRFGGCVRIVFFFLVDSLQTTSDSLTHLGHCRTTAYWPLHRGQKKK